MGGGGTTVRAPQPSPEERALQRQQTELLKQQTTILQANLEQQNLLSPFLYKSVGLEPIYGDNGKITGYRELPATPEEAAQKQLTQQFLERSLASLQREEAAAPQNAEIEGLLRQRSLAALKGELPVDPTVINQLNDTEQNLRAQLFKQLGPGYETSTPGIQALAEFQKRKAEVIAGANRADLTLGEQLGMARQGANEQSATDYLNSQQLSSNLRQSRLGNIFNISQAPAQIGLQGYGQIAQGYNAPIQWYSNQRQQQMNAQIANAQSDSSGMGAFGSLLGTGITAAAYYF